MKVVVLKEETFINGRKRASGEVVVVDDSFDERRARQILTRKLEDQNLVDKDTTERDPKEPRPAPPKESDNGKN